MTKDHLPLEVNETFLTAYNDQTLFVFSTKEATFIILKDKSYVINWDFEHFELQQNQLVMYIFPKLLILDLKDMTINVINGVAEKF